jgi:hypothetical protein
MKRVAMVLAVAGIIAGSSLSAEKTPAAKGEKPARPKIEVAFVLDTTGSMSGLIAGAKAKIWSIANQIVLGRPKPIVRMALVPYRDKGDAYVTKVYDLTDNIDQVYEHLMGFKAQAGGDRPENVNQALHDAVHKLSWSKERGTLKIIYLVGDSPPHNEYTDVPTYDKTAKAAIEKGIYVNTILCGGADDTAKIWQQIALAAEGEFFKTQQNGGTVHVSSPYDKDLGRLNAELTGTVVVYGSKAEQIKNAKLNMSMSKIAESGLAGAAGAAADRAAFAAVTGRAGTGDLADAVAQKKVELERLKKDDLPENMRKMTLAEQKVYLGQQLAQRREIARKIQQLSAKRAAHIRKELEKKEGAKDSFDAQVLKSLKAQAARRAIRYE